MASAQEKIAEHLQCAVCLEQITDSRLLSCQHTFCLACLNRLFQQANDPMRLACPSCRQDTSISEAGPVGLQKNRLVNQLVEMLQASQVDRPMCEEPECSVPLHCGERRVVFCKTCQKTICFKCAAVEHQACQKGDLQNAFSEKEILINNLIDKIQGDIIKPLQSATGKAKKYQQMSKASAEEADRDIDKHFDICQQLLDDRRKQLHSEVQRHCDAWQTCLQQMLNELTADFHNAMQITDSIKQSISSETKSSVFSHAPESIDQLTSLHQGYKKLSEQLLPKPQAITFSANSQALQKTLDNMGAVITNKLAVRHTPTIALQNLTSTFVVDCSQPTAPPVVHVKPPKGGAASEVVVDKHGEADDSYLIKLKTRALGKHKVHVQVSSYEMKTVDKAFDIQSLPVPDNLPKRIIGKRGNGDYEFNFPGSITVCGEDHILVADSGNKRIQEFDSCGRELVRSFIGTGEFAAATLHPLGVVLATNPTQHEVQAFNHDGQVRHIFGSRGSEAGQYLDPYGIAVTSDDHMVVAEGRNRRVQVIDIVTGTPIRQITSCSQDRKLQSPFSVVVDPSDGHILVSDCDQHTIEEFTKDGQHVHSIGRVKTEIGPLVLPLGIALHPSGHLLVCEAGNRRVSIFSREGEGVGLLGDNVGGSPPHSVACNERGEVFVAHRNQHCIHFY